MARLYQLQIRDHDHYKELSFINQLNIEYNDSQRGFIFDHNHHIIAYNEPQIDLVTYPGEYKKHQAKIHTTLNQHGITPHKKYIKRQLAQQTSNQPITLKANLTPREAVIWGAISFEHPYLHLHKRLQRIYPDSELYSHILGYLSLPNREQIQAMKQSSAHTYHLAGKTGIESLLENELRGRPGWRISQRDAKNKIIQKLNESPATPGADAVLTLDHKLQSSAGKAIKGHKGSVVIIDPNNGDILAMVNAPSYDANVFQTHDTHGIDKINQHPEQPLFNRALRGQFPLASTIKPFLAISALSNNIINASDQIEDTGQFQVNEHSRVFHDWKPDGHGLVNLKKALMVSCDTYFYQLGVSMGIDLIHSSLLEFGFGQPSGIELPGEQDGLIPSRAWKKAHHQEPWYIGDTIISAIGQGAMLTTPLQLANATATLANHGKHFQPHLIKKITFADGTEQVSQPTLINTIDIDEKHWATITNAMTDTAKYGTCRRLGQGPYEVACKTGTAQVITNTKSKKNQAKNLNDHSLIIAFAPPRKPEIAVAVIIENERSAIHVTKQILDDYFIHNKQDTDHEPNHTLA